MLTRRVAIIAGTAVLALSGATYAVAHGIGGGDPEERKAFLNDAAERLNVTPEELTKALKEAAIARVDQAVKDGKLTREQADQIKERIQQGDGLPGPGPGGPGGPGHHHGPPPGMDAAADYLGLSGEELREQLMDGKSLADIAEEKDKSVDGLKDAMEKAIRADIEKAVDDGRLTQQQADRILEGLDQRLDEKVERTGPPHRGGPGGRGFGPGGPGGPGFGPPPGGPPPPGDAPQDN